METTERSYKSPMEKLMAFFGRSRDGWKAKHHELKKQLKKEQNQVRAVEKSRAAWRQKAEDAQQQLEALRQELAGLKKDAGATAALHGTCRSLRPAAGRTPLHLRT